MQISEYICIEQPWTETWEPGDKNSKTEKTGSRAVGLNIKAEEGP